jgi:AcrR family transcriptional regulator
MRQDERSSQLRLLAAAKALFAQKGYEATTIADITRAAKTSHSQFLKYYSGKEELRREIIEQQWSELTKSVILAMTGVASASEKLKLALNMFVSFLESDREFRTILLLEQTACHQGNGPVISREFREFIAVLDDIIDAVRTEGGLVAKIDAQALRSALVGSIEGMMRDQLLAKSGFPAQYSLNQVRATLSMLLSAACEVQRPAVAAEAPISAAESVLGRSPEDDWIRYYLKLADSALNPEKLS